MYGPLLLIHSWTRWAVVLALAYFFVKATYGWIARRPWTGADSHFMWAFNQLLGYQVLFGFALWIGASPIVKVAFKNPQLALQDGVISFWALRHGLTMIFALGAFHMGHARAKRGPAERRCKIYSITFLVLIALIGSAIPWPWLAYGRPLFRGFL
jgi:hypothetical protein